MDINKPVENPIVVEKLNQFKFDNSNESLLELLYTFNNANFLAPVIITGNISNGIMQKGTTIQFKTIKYSTNDFYYLAFTDWNELRKWSNENEQTLVLSFDDLKTLFDKGKDNISGFVINPFTQNFMVNKYAIEYFDKIYIRKTVEKDTNVRLKPYKLSEELSNELLSVIAPFNEVNSIYLYESCYENEPVINLFCIINIERNKDVLIPMISKIIQKILKNNQYLDVVEFDEKYHNLIDIDAAVYSRK